MPSIEKAERRDEKRRREIRVVRDKPWRERFEDKLTVDKKRREGRSAR